MSAAAMAVSGSVVAAATTTLSSSAHFGSSGVQQLGALRSPTSLNGSRIVAVRASHTSESSVRSKALVALVAAGAAFALNVTPIPTSSGSAIALDLNSLIDNVKELSNNIPSSGGEEGKNTAVELAKRAAQQAARDFASGDADSKTNRLLDSAKELAGNIPNFEGNEEAKKAAIDIAKNAAQGAATNGSQDSNGSTASNLFETVKTLSGKIPGFDGDKMVQNAAVDMAKGAATGAASNAARDFADNAKNRIGMEAGKALLNKFTGGNDN
ncbi:hypothetical protein M758_7G007900 [Ceratodon purpureus]|nr:hypothetical protein M758_7G007900 [Ceratodon purpureus]